MLMFNIWTLWVLPRLHLPCEFLPSRHGYSTCGAPIPWPYTFRMKLFLITSSEWLHVIQKSNSPPMLLSASVLCVMWSWQNGGPLQCELRDFLVVDPQVFADLWGQPLCLLLHRLLIGATDWVPKFVS